MAQPKARHRARATRGGAAAQPLMAVRDVQTSARWYATVLDAQGAHSESDHAHLYRRITRGRRILLQLHAWDEEDHPNLVSRPGAPVGHGVLIWFEVQPFAAALRRLRAMKAEIVLKPHVNPNAHHWEVWARDPDGYVVVLASRGLARRPAPARRAPARGARAPAAKRRR